MSDIDELFNKGLLSDDEGVSHETREILASENFTEIISFHEDTYITIQGKPVDAFYFTLEGLFHAISHENPSAPQRLLGRIEGGQFIGEISLVNKNNTATATVKALKNARALKMTRDSFKAFCDTHPAEAIEFVLAIARQLGTRLRQANEKVL